MSKRQIPKSSKSPKKPPKVEVTPPPSPPLAEVPVLPEPERFARRINRSESGNAEIFAAVHKERVRFDYNRQKWIVWSGHSWILDDAGEALELARDCVRRRLMRAARDETLPDRVEEMKFCVRSEDRKGLLNLLALAQTNPSLRVAESVFNTNPWLLGVANGVIDLRTGKLRDGTPGDLISLASSLPFNSALSDASCPTWIRFVNDIFAGHPGLVAFLQRALGYTLTGEISEQSLFAGHGSGANGKSTLFDIIHFILGKLAANTSFHTFERRAFSAPTNDIAGLVGVRFVTASETGEDIRLNEARVKSITGGDPLTCRFHYKEFFTYRPQFKLWLAFNHRPLVHDTSEGFWRRVLMIPFEQKFSGARADRRLPEKLRAEAEAILAWMIRGCLEWQRGGLDPPPEVLAATQDYRAEEDILSRFVAERCVQGEKAQIPAGVFYEAYVAWSSPFGETMSLRTFGEQMRERFTRTDKEAGRVYLGVELKPKES